jgi:hypothetical protein
MLPILPVQSLRVGALVDVGIPKAIILITLYRSGTIGIATVAKLDMGAGSAPRALD